MKCLKLLPVFCLLVSVLVATPEKRPNLVLILADDLGWGNLGSYGGPIEAPSLDRLAQDGVRFTQFYNYARCCPTRAMLMTGLHPHEVGVGHMTFRRGGKNPSNLEERLKLPAAYRGWLRETIPTLPQMLRTAGYGTYMSGKWHIANNDLATWPTNRGFDRFYGFMEGTSEYFKPTDLWRGTERIEPQGERYYTTDAFTDEAIGYLREHAAQKPDAPFFLYLAYNAPHFPMQAMPEDFAKYRGRFKEGWDVLRERTLERQKKLGLVPASTVLSPRSGEMDRLGVEPGAVPPWDSLKPEQQDALDAVMATYAAMVDRMDQNIGRLVEHLRATGQLDNTVIIFLSDNGGEAEGAPLGQFQAANLGAYGKGGRHYGRGWANASNTPFREFKHFTHEGGVMTPLIVHWPAGIPAERRGSLVREFGFLPDVVETLLDVGAAQRPSEIEGKPAPEVDGRTLRPLLAGQPAAPRGPVCVEHEGNRLVRDGQWKLVGYFDEPWELYDLHSDPTELNNRAAAEPAVVKRLAAAYEAWAVRTGARPWKEAQHYSVYPPDSKYGTRK
jgi:arylsulfatase A-like enzyme